MRVGSVLSPIRTRTWTQISASGGPGKVDTAWEGPGGPGAQGGEGHSASSSSCHQLPRPQPSRASTVSPNASLPGGSSYRPAEQLVALLTRTKPGVGQTKCCYGEKPMKKPSLPGGGGHASSFAGVLKCTSPTRLPHSSVWFTSNLESIVTFSSSPPSPDSQCDPKEHG